MTANEQVERVASDITPTTEDVGDAYARARIYLDGEGEYADPSAPDNWSDARGEFDRWVASATGTHRPEMRWHNDDDPNWHEGGTCVCGLRWPHETTPTPQADVLAEVRAHISGRADRGLRYIQSADLLAILDKHEAKS